MNLKLIKPFQYGSGTISELDIREPKAKDFRRMPMQPTMGDMLNLLGSLTGHAPSVIDELSVEDMTKATEIVAGFFPSSPPTGGKP
jgi:hypothetical protein